MTIDAFEEAGAATGGGVRPPALAQLVKGAPAVKRDYAKGDPAKEILGIQTTGRLIVFMPVLLEKNVPGPEGKPQDRLSVDMTVLDGEPIDAVLDKHGEATFTPDAPWVAPFFLPKVFVSQLLIVGQLVNVDGTLKTRPVIGRLGLLPKNGKGYRAYAILSATPEEKKAAAPVYEQLKPNVFD